MFKGPGGIYLYYLTRISITYLDILYSIEFYYNTKNVLIEYRKLGRYKSSKYTKVIHFSINSPSREVIDAIKVYLRYYIGENVF